MARNSTGTKIVRYILWGLIGLFVLGAFIGMARKSAQEAADRAYHEKAYPVLSQLTPADITGDKAVAYQFVSSSDKEGTYTSRNVPEGYATEDPTQVRYVIKRTVGSKLEGTYSGGGGSGFRRTLTVEILDLKTGQVLGTQTFNGGPPPTSVKSSSTKVHYGSYPSESKVSEWVLSILP